MNRFFYKGRMVLLPVFLHCFIAAQSQTTVYNTRIADTLRRSNFRYEVRDTSLIQILKTNEADSFSSQPFNAFKGVSTFRGGPYRDFASVGTIEKRPEKLSLKWVFNTHPKGEWGGGAGWTGQPSVVQWPDSIRNIMNVREPFKSQSDFQEVIFGSLDGHIYFLDFATGRPSRMAIDIKNPIKGSVTIDPRGYPILYCGQGIELAKDFGFRIFSLIDQQRMYYINGYDSFALRGWAAFDGAALINPRNDRMYLGGENGIVYALKLNTTFKPKEKTISINPQVVKYRYQYKLIDEHKEGIENSVVAWKDKLFFADNHGFIQSLDINTFKPQWFIQNHDDTDASLVLAQENQVPYLYTGNEVDKQKDPGYAFLKKINGLTGETEWVRKFECLTIRGDHPVNGGLLSTPLVGKKEASDRVIFCLSRYEAMNKGLLVALDKATGATLFEVRLKHYAWSSPVDIYDQQGNMYIFLADSKGYVSLFDGCDGALIYEEKITDLFEASPAVFDNKIIIPGRPSKVFCLEIK